MILEIVGFGSVKVLEKYLNFTHKMLVFLEMNAHLAAFFECDAAICHLGPE